MERETAVRQIERRLAGEAGIHAVVEERGGVLTLSGKVSSAEQRRTATEIVRALAPGMRVDNDLEIEQVAPENLNELFQAEPSAGLIPDEMAGLSEDDAELAADFTNQPLTTNPIPVIETAEETYFPPTDPVVTVSDDGDVEVLGGLTPTSDTVTEPAPSTLDSVYGDEAIADAVRTELREDAATTSLRIQVGVRAGTFVLRGRVADMQDAENAEAVAARVPGVIEVREELEVRDV